MKKLLVMLSLFLLTNVSLANPFAEASKNTNPIPPKQLQYTFLGSFELVIAIIFMILLFIGILMTIRCNKILTTQEIELKEKKKLENKSVIYLLLPFIILVCFQIIKMFLSGSIIIN